MGPLNNEDTAAKVDRHLAEARANGARVLTGGGRAPDRPTALYYEPTIVDGVAPGMLLNREETFGPVAPVRVVASFAEGLEAARRGRYGLAAVVLTPSLEHAQRAWRELPVGTVKVNAVFGGAPGGAAHPRGASGTGFGYGPELLDELTVTKVVHIAMPG